MSRINELKAKEILDSRGKPTVEVKLETDDGVFVASVPSGTSEGKYEAEEVKASKAVENINKIIAPKLKERDPKNQKEIDGLMIELDGTKNKSKLGANAILAVSIAVLRAGAKAKNLFLWKYISQLAKIKPGLPKPSVLLIEGGLHAKNKPHRMQKPILRGKLDFQEFMIVTNFQQAKEIYQKLGKILNPVRDSEDSKEPKSQRISNGVKAGTGMEGGFAPQISDPKEALDLIMEADEGYEAKIGLDCAVSHFKKNKYNINFYQDLVKKYPIIFLEDPFSEDDWESWQGIFKKMDKKVIIVGDDLLTTNIQRIKKAKQKKACNGVIIKPDQIGTITEVIGAVKLAKSYGWKIIVSHRSGETLDDFIADLAVGVGADFIKSGAPFQKERLAKYNRLLQIEKELK